MWKKTLIPVIASGVFMSMNALEVKQSEREFAVSTSRLEATVKDGRIIHLVNRQNGNVVADRAVNETSHTAGLGNMTGQVGELSKLHFPWGEPSLKQDRPNRPTKLYRRPTAESKFQLEKQGNAVRATWQGLSDGETFFASDSITLEFGEDEQGALVLRGTGKSEQGGVFGLQVPVENLRGEGKFILPTFGGLEYEATGKPSLLTFKDSTLFYEAPLMTYTVQDSALGMWIEDRTFRPFFAFFGRSERGSSFALEPLNLIPYENLKILDGPIMKLDVFSDAGWIAAARPYRDWYRKTFAADIARRDSIAWAEKINVIVDGGTMYSPATLKAVAALMKPESVLFHVWQARKEGFTTNIPDYTPKKDYAGHVKQFHDHGFKVMCYVCSLCAVYRSPVWDRDKVGEFFLTRKNDIANYHGGKNAFDENLAGTITAAVGDDPFANFQAGKLYYGDPLSRRWREYFAQIVYDFNQLTGTDANYQDTLGCAGDVGNGTVEGLAGGEGNAVFTRELQARMPNTPMASEYGPSQIAFGVKWPLNYPQVWGSIAFRKFRAGRHHPLTPFLFGYRTWNPVINAGDDFHKYLISACSDALSGMGMFTAAENMQMKEGFDGLLLLRSKIFADHDLTPYYPEKRYPENIRAMYRSRDGKIFRYYDDGSLQMMLDPDNKPLYGRVTGVSQLKNTQLTLPGWPVRDRDGIYGLDPEQYYALFPVNGSNVPNVAVKPLPPGVKLVRYYATADFAYLEFDGNGEIGIELRIPAGYVKGYVNDRSIDITAALKISGPLPMRVFLTNGKETVPNRVRNINISNGLQSGKGEALPSLRKQLNGQEFFHVNGYQVKSLDFVLTVKNPDDALELLLQNTQNQYGNGSIVRLLLNGKEIKSFDCAAEKRGGKPVFDTKIRRWLAPLAQYAGQEVLVTVQVDNKASNNADMQWITIPKVVKDTTRQFRETIVKPVETPRKPVRPEGTPVQTIVPDWNSTLVTSENEVFRYSPNTPHGMITATGRLNIDRTKVYYLSGEFRRPAADGGAFHLGVVQYRADGRPISGVEVNPLTGTDTVLGRAGQAGSTTIKVMDASGWRPGGMVAVNTSPDRSDLPNSDLHGPVTELVRTGGDWTITLKNPLKRDIESDTSVRLHLPAGTHHYVASAKLSEQWQSFSGVLSWWPGAEKFQIMMLAKSPLEFRNLKLEVIDAAR